MTQLTAEQEVRRAIFADSIWKSQDLDQHLRDASRIADWILYGEEGKPEEVCQNNILSGVVDALRGLEDSMCSKVEEPTPGTVGHLRWLLRGVGDDVVIHDIDPAGNLAAEYEACEVHFLGDRRIIIRCHEKDEGLRSMPNNNMLTIPKP